MNSEGLAYSERLPAHERRPAYGESRLTHAPERESEGTLDRRTELGLGVAIVVPVVAAYAAITYALYVLLGAVA